MATNTYKIKGGDTLGKIAKQYGTTVESLASTNKIKDVNKISAGATLNIPGTQASMSTPGVNSTPATGTPSTIQPPTQRQGYYAGNVTNTQTGNTNTNYYPKVVGQPQATPQANAPMQSGQATPAPVVDPKAQAQEYAGQVNAISEQVANTKDDIPKSRSAQMIESIYSAIENGDDKAPDTPKLMDLYEDTRKNLGIDQDENDLADIDNEIQRIQVGALVGSDEAGDRPVGMQQIERRRGNISKEAQRQIAFLDVERTAVARTVQGKTDALKMVMDFTQQDYTNASQSYQNKFNKNLQMVQLLQGQEDRETSAATRLQDTAKANISTVMSMMTESGKTFDDLPANQKAQLNQWELQAGFPSGLLQSLPPETGELMTIGGNLVRVYPDDTIKVVYSKPASSGGSGGGSRSSSGKNFTATNIPNDLLTDITSDIKSGATLAELYSAYDDISTAYISSLYSSLGTKEESLGKPSFSGKAISNLDNNPLFGKSRRERLQDAGIADTNRIVELANQGYDSKQISQAMKLTTSQKELLDKYI